MPAVRRRISSHAARLRRDRTDAEDLVWQRIRNRQLGGFKFRFQHSLHPHVADFVCLEAMVIVEIDGGQHEPSKDAKRTAHLESRGFEVVRFWNNEVMENLEGVLLTILAAAERRVLIAGRR